MRNRLIYLFCILMVTLSCQEQEQYVLQLQTPQQTGNTVVLNWEEPEISDFKHYIVMRASDGQHYQVINDTHTETSDAFRKEVTTFTDSTYPLEADTLYYKIMAIGDKNISSENILFVISKRPYILIENVQSTYLSPDAGKLSAVCYQNGYKLKVYNLESRQFMPQESTIDLSTTGHWYLWGAYNGKAELYNYDSNNTLYVYDAITTQQITSMKAPSNLWYDPRVSNEQGIIYIHDYNVLYSLNRSTGGYNVYRTENSISSNYIYYNSRNNQLYINDGYNKIIVFNLDENGNVTSDVRYTINHTGMPPLFVRKSSLFFVRNNNKFQILDMQTQEYHPVDIQINNYYAYEESAVLSGEYIYVSDGNSHAVYQISSTDYTVKKVIPTRALPKQIFVSGDYLYYLGQYNNGYLLDKIKL